MRTVVHASLVRMAHPTSYIRSFIFRGQHTFRGLSILPQACMTAVDLLHFSSRANGPISLRYDGPVI
jgi:hypothetical protein